MDTDDASHLRCMIFERTSPVARDAVGSQEQNIWDTQTEFDRGISDVTPHGYDTAWDQIGCDDFEDTAPDWNLNPAEVRAAYRLVAALDHDTLNLFARDEAYGLLDRIATEAAAIAKTEQADAEPEADEEEGDVVTCPRCEGRMGFHHFRHVPHRHVGGLCFLCDGKGAVLVPDAEAFLAKQQADKDARTARDHARATERRAAEEAAHAAAFDRYGDEYRLVHALARYDHPATLGATIDLNAYRANDPQAMRRVRDRLPYVVEEAGLAGLGLEEIEALGTLTV
jgi:hypothetical protein